MEFKERIGLIKELIASDQLEKAIFYLKEETQSQGKHNEVLAYQGELNALKKRIRLNDISEDGKTRSLNRLRFSLLDYCDTLIKSKENNSNQSPSWVTQNFKNLIEDKTKGFIGREWLLSEIEERIKRSTKGYIIIKGEPGIGKSAILSKIILENINDCIYHFNVRSSGLNTTYNFVKNILHQLCEKFGIKEYMITSESLQNGILFHETLNRVSEILVKKNKKLLVVIDALDEVKNKNKTLIEEYNILYLPEYIPENIFFVLSYRTETDNDFFLKINPILDIKVLNQKDSLNRADSKKFIERSINLKGIKKYLTSNSLSHRSFIEIMLEKSQSNFMYLKHVLPKIEQGFYESLDVNELPIGLKNYYEDHWKKMIQIKSDTWYTDELLIITLLSLTDSPLSTRTISEILRIGISKVTGSINFWREFLFIESLGFDIPAYRIYHSAYKEYLNEKSDIREERGLVQDCYVNYFMGLDSNHN